MKLFCQPRAALALIFCFALTALEAQAILVMPLRSESISPELSGELASHLESALVDSGLYEVTSPADTALLLEAQSLAYSGVYREEDLPKLGAFLPAKLALLGRIEGRAKDARLVLKILELERGNILKSGSYGLPGTLPSLQAGAKGLDAWIHRSVFSLLGLVEAGGQAAGYELLVSADIADCLVYVDRRLRGRSPCAVSGLAGGEHVVELKKGSYYASRLLRLESNQSIDFIMGQRYGSIIIRSEPENPDVTVGRDFYGQKGLIEKVPAEKQLLTLRKPGLFWQGYVPLSPNSTTTVQVRLLATASLSVEAEAGSSLRLSRLGLEGSGLSSPGLSSPLLPAEGYLRDIPLPGRLEDLLPGSYKLHVQRANRESLEMEINLEAGESRVIELRLDLPRLRAQERDDILKGLESIRAAQAALALDEASLRLPQADLGLQASGDLFLSFIPVVNSLLLLRPSDQPAGLPPALQRQIRSRRLGQFALGNLCALGILAAVLAPSSPHPREIGGAGIVVAAAAGAADIGISMEATLRLGRYSRQEKLKRDGWLELETEILSLRARLKELEN